MRSQTCTPTETTPPRPSTAATLDFDHLLPSHGKPILNTARQAVRDFVAKDEAKATGRMARLRRVLLGPSAG